MGYTSEPNYGFISNSKSWEINRNNKLATGQ